MAFWKIVSAMRNNRTMFNFPREFRTKQTMINFAKSKGLEIFQGAKFDELGQELETQTITP